MNTPELAAAAPTRSTLQAPPGATLPFGEQLRQMRAQRRLSQLALATQAGVSARHLCFVETGRAAPSREMVLRLAHGLEVPMRERNQWLMAAGFAPMYSERALDGDGLAAARAAVQRLLDCQAPFPAIAMDRHWNLVAANSATSVLLGDADPTLVGSPPNVLRLCHHPQAMAPRIANLAQVRANHALRLRQQIRATADPVLTQMLAELESYPLPAASQSKRVAGEYIGVVAPFQVHSRLGVLSFFTATTIFGSVADITLSELAMELFLPADAFTAATVPTLVAEA